MNNTTYINNYINQLTKDNTSSSSNTYTNNAISNKLSSFLDVINSENNIYYSTGIPSIDELLNGGLANATITVLGGICGVGKSTMALQAAWYISKTYEKDVLFLACEMSEFQMQVKLISQLTSRMVKEKQLSIDPLSYDDIQFKKNWDKWSDEQAELFCRAMDEIQDNTHLYIRSIVGHTSVNEIKNAIELHIKQTGNVPVIFLDYLQNVREQGIINADKQVIDAAVYMLNSVAHEYNTPVVALSSLGRSSYEKPSLGAAKGSGEIEYSASNVILLTSAEAKAPTSTRPSARTSARTAPIKGIKVQATCVKSRFGGIDKFTQLTFLGQYNLFTETI